ncbi:MAG: glutamine-hydrolyzing GMP synthase, partial [Alphaproteobacteria bacterium]
MATSSPISEKILIIDFGSQVTQLIARRIREAGVYSEVHPCFRIDKAFLDVYQPKAIVLSGGPASVMAEGAPTIDPLVFELGIPVLGICYGQQLMCHLLGGKVEDSDHQEFGRASLDIGVDDCALFDGVWSPGDQPQVWMSHGDRVTALPEGFRVVATSSGAPFAATTDAARGFYGVQFHPEVVHTIDGSKLLFNFVRNIAGCSGTWTMAAYKTAAIEKIRAQVGDSRVICGLSGGVDSSVAAVLIHEAIGDQLTCIFVDHGLLRMNEGAEVDKVFRERFNIPLVTRNAADMFLDQLEGVDDPEQKRKIIGSTFIDVFDEEAAKLGGADFLAQGTLYPDVIESVSPFGGPSETIKSHHNVGGLPERMNMKLVEPLRELFKDEVRDLGRELGIPEDIVGRHPFPGPGLAIRMPGAMSRDNLDILRKADAIYLDEIRK